MIPPTLLMYLILNSAMQWEFDSVVHLNGTGGLAYCEQMQRWKEEAFTGKVGDLRVVCTKDEGSNA